LLEALHPRYTLWYAYFFLFSLFLFIVGSQLITHPIVIQNNLQYVAASNLDAATFQVTYQMKILTTAAFSVVMLRKKLSPVQWMALLFLAIGVGIVQIQSGAPASHVVDLRSMEPIKGFMAVFAACFTSGLAGVYFEMVLKNSQADLWVRNVQLSAFSLLPALVPIFFAVSSSTSGQSWFQELFHDFGAWAWATVSIQVLGGLITAMVIKYADNIMKGFATSLSIVISFLASVALFDFEMTVTFVLGSSIVLVATWLYNQPAKGTATTTREKSRCTALSLNEKWAAYGPATTATMAAPALSRSTSASRVTVTSTSRTVSTASLSSLSSFDRDELMSGRTSVDSSDDEDDIKKATRWNVSAATLPALMNLRKTSL
jgi:solute carrier family 35 (UDP-sugar transporter), member A1/2/3